MPTSKGATDQHLTVADLGQRLHGLLHHLVSAPGRWVAAVEDDRQRYVQVLATADGSLYAEVTSNNFLTDDDRWSEGDEAVLTSLGWEPPCLPERPNWNLYQYVFVGPPKALHLAGLIMCTLRSPFRLRDEHRLRLRVFRSGLDGAS